MNENIENKELNPEEMEQVNGGFAIRGDKVIIAETHAVVERELLPQP